VLEQLKVIVFGLEVHVLKRHVMMHQLLIFLMQIVKHFYLLVLWLELVDVLQKQFVKIIRLNYNVQMEEIVFGILDNYFLVLMRNVIKLKMLTIHMIYVQVLLV
jgi:hypothetical protein